MNKLFLVDADGILFLVVSKFGLDATNCVKDEIKNTTGTCGKCFYTKPISLKKANKLFDQDLLNPDYITGLREIMDNYKNPFIVCCSEDKVK